MGAAGSGQTAIRVGAGLAALAVAAALALPACGGGGGEAQAQAQARAPSEATAVGGADKGAEASAATACRDQLGTFVIGMDELRRNLVAGLDYEGYVAEMKKVRRAYEAIPIARLELPCLRAAGTPGENAFNRYIAAANTWTDCVEADGCEAATIEAALQAKWRQASRYLSKAQSGLRDQPAG